MKRKNLRWFGLAAAVLWLLFAAADPSIAPSEPGEFPPPAVTSAGMVSADIPFPTATDDGWAPAPALPLHETPRYLDTQQIRQRVLDDTRREEVVAARGEAPRLERREPASPIQQAVAPPPPPPPPPPDDSSLPVTLQWPITDSYISSYFGWRNGVIHEGIDLPQQEGHPIMAAAPGVVIASGWDGGFGYCVMIDHGSGLKTRYAHASQLIAGVGEAVEAGQVVALVGNTGNSFGNHLHFEVIVDGTPRDPLAYLP